MGKSSASADYRDRDTTQCSSVQSHKGTGYNAIALMGISDEHNFDSSCMDDKDNEVDDSDISTAEDLEVRMDFTDDLLHMVCLWKS